MSDPERQPNGTASGGKRDRRGARHAARIAAVQALYQMELTGAPVGSVASEFVEHRFTNQKGPVDQRFFESLLRDVVDRQIAVDRGLARTLIEGWELEKLDSTLRALLRAGSCELMFRPDVPVRVVLNEYTEIANDFFAEQERAFANGVLNSVARTARPGEFESDSSPEQ